MSIGLKYGGQLLIGGGSKDTGTIKLKEGHSVQVSSTGIFQGTGPIWKRQRVQVLVVEIGETPIAIQRNVRRDINRIQKAIHERAPEYEYPKRGGGLLVDRSAYQRGGRFYGRPMPRPKRPEPIKLEKPPEKVHIPDTYQLYVLAHGVIDGLPYLEVGKKLTVMPQEPYDHRSYILGQIESFMLST